MDYWDLRRALRYIAENPTEVQLFCMLGIVLTLVVCGYMVFGMGQGLWFPVGIAAIAVQVGIIVLCQRFER